MTHEEEVRTVGKLIQLEELIENRQDEIDCLEHETYEQSRDSMWKPKRPSELKLGEPSEPRKQKVKREYPDARSRSKKLAGCLPVIIAWFASCFAVWLLRMALNLEDNLFFTLLPVPITFGIDIFLNDRRKKDGKRIEESKEFQDEIAELDRQYNAKQAEYEARLAVCKEQLRAMQRLDGGGALWLLTQAKSLYHLLTFDTVLRQMSAKNSAVLAELDAEAAALEQARAEAEDAARRAEDARAELEGQQTALHTAQSQLEAALLDANSTLTAQQAAAQAQTTVTDAAKKAYEEATAALDAYVRAQSRRYTTAELRLTSLDFRCPLDSYGRITTQFGEADPWGIPHRGTDFAAPGGTPIYAIADGIVSAARAMNSYGNCVQVSHGTADDGCRYDSLYAHMSSIAVAEGTAVRRGDLLGYVGNTGNVYGTGGGYHLHLELRVNGSRTDPLGYVPSR